MTDDEVKANEIRFPTKADLAPRKESLKIAIIPRTESDNSWALAVSRQLDRLHHSRIDRFENYVDCLADHSLSASTRIRAALGASYDRVYSVDAEDGRGGTVTSHHKCGPSSRLTMEQACASLSAALGEAEPVSEDSSVDHPTWYTHGSIEVLDFILAWDLDFMSGSCLKYLVRAPYKGDELEDLKKARFYLNKLIERCEKKEK